MPDISFNQTETEKLNIQIEKKYAPETDYTWIARHLGAHVNDDHAVFVCWHPDFEKEQNCSAFLEVFIPKDNIRYSLNEQTIRCRHIRLSMQLTGPFACSVVNGLPAGDRQQFGAFYQFILKRADGSQKVFRDPMAYSLPFGIHAPAELYDTNRVLKSRKDTGYFQNMDLAGSGNGGQRISPPVNLLEIHPGTTTKEGSLEALAKTYQKIGDKIRKKTSLTPFEQNLTGFDAVELMPVDPVIEHPENHLFWAEQGSANEDNREVDVRLTKPGVTNWGYDVAIFGAAAINPSLLATGRPHELLELIETLHTLPGRPVKVILDVVYGHAHNQARHLLPEDFFAGRNVYGQNIRFHHPVVRTMILEMFRRKMNWGFDGVRVDASQDIKRYDNTKDEMVCDDAFLADMSDIEPRIGDLTYKPWMIFEDGRPWPRDDWELASTYREVIKQQDHAFQWAPMIFSYNTPFNYTYWVSKWWRIREILTFGDRWISGYANHDTLRRGIQADPTSANVNWLLGDTPKEVMKNSYNHPATTLVMNGFLPGVPLDFMHALCNTPWSFIRNTDTDYAVKVAAEEAFFTYWKISTEEFKHPEFFKELKNMGFSSLTELQRFATTLLKFIEALNYNPANIAGLLNRVDPAFEVSGWTKSKLNDYASAWFADLHHFCNAAVRSDLHDESKSEYNLQVRNFRLRNRWLRNSLNDRELFSYRTPVDGSVIFYGYRISPDDGTELILAANMEGQPSTVNLNQLHLPVDLSGDWSAALTTPGLEVTTPVQPFELSISQGVIFQKRT